MIRFKATTFTIHLAGWLLFLTFPLLFMQGPQGADSIVHLLQSPHYWQFCLCYLTIFYLNTQILFPFLILPKRYVLYVLALAGLFAGVFFLKPFDRLLGDYPGPESEFRSGRPIIPQPRRFNPFQDRTLDSIPPPMPDIAHRPAQSRTTHFPKSGPHGYLDTGVIDITGLFIFLIILALSTATRTVEQWQYILRQAAQAEAEKLQAQAEKSQAELAFLKAQINPHFLFNTLNNIYMLAVMQSSKTAESILKISNILRYVIDETSHDSVRLTDEIACLQNYIDLQSLRLNQHTQVSFEVAGASDHYSIAPLILLTFVENAFKYGVSNHESASIAIRLTMSDNTLTFFCQNRIFAGKPATERSGIGLRNTQQRLAHLYPGRHELVTHTGNGFYTVTLTLKM